MDDAVVLGLAVDRDGFESGLLGGSERGSQEEEEEARGEVHAIETLSHMHILEKTRRASKSFLRVSLNPGRILLRKHRPLAKS